MALNWQSLLALILQILAVIHPAPAAAFGEHSADIKERALDAGLSLDTVTKLLAYVEANWATLVKLLTDAEQIFA